MRSSEEVTIDCFILVNGEDWPNNDEWTSRRRWMALGLRLCFSFNFLSFLKENILDYNNNVQSEVISKALLGAASASRGKRLELSDYVIIFQRQFFLFIIWVVYIYLFYSCSFVCSSSSLSVGVNIGSLSLFAWSIRSSFFLIPYLAKKIIFTRPLRMFL